MPEAVGQILAAIGVFAGTNVDDLIVLAVLFAAARSTSQPRPGQIWLGQAVGVAILVAVSAVAAVGLTVVPTEHVRLLGLVPLGLGIAGLTAAIADHRRGATGDAGRRIVANGALSVVALTVANGADNIAVYTPMFRTLDVATTALTVAVFSALVAVWCAAGTWLGSHRAVLAVLRRSGPWLVPGVFVAIGAVILRG